MRNSVFLDTIFDTRVDTEKFFVPMKHKFVLRNTKDKHGLSPLYLHVTQDYDRLRIPLDLKFDTKLWNVSKQRLKPKNQEHTDINLIIDNIDKKITNIKTTYRLNETHLTLEKFKVEFFSASSRVDFVSFMKNMLEEMKPIMNTNTHKAETSIYRKLAAYSERLFFSDITMAFVNNFRKHLLIDKRNAETTVNKNMAIIKKYLNIATKRGIKLPLDTEEIYVGPTDGERTNLDGEEIDVLAEYFCSRFLRPNHKVPLGLFLLACFNGLRISDAQQLTPGKIDKGKIIFTSVKTGKRQILKINLTTERILEMCPEVLTEKYADQHHNRKLKEICNLVGIKKHVTFHVARHTFATNYLRLGGKVEVLQQILGHSKITQTMVYVHIVQEEQDRGMDILDGLIEGSHFSQLHDTSE